MPHPKHDAVRRRYDFRCGYCNVSKADAGGEHTVDHYQPVHAGGDDSDGNLVYACFRCNVNKGMALPFLPSTPPQQQILHPLRDDISAHIREDTATGLLTPWTDVGRFHIALLDLNRLGLVRHRQRNYAIAAMEIERDVARQAQAEQERVITSQSEYIRVLEGLVRRILGGDDETPTV